MKTTLVFISILILTVHSKALIRNVPGEYPTIQSAILACSNGDTVLVEPGTYNQPLEPGTYELRWDASGYASGIYIYRLTSGDYSETRKMILHK